MYPANKQPQALTIYVQENDKKKSIAQNRVRQTMCWKKRCKHIVLYSGKNAYNVHNIIRFTVHNIIRFTSTLSQK